MRSVGKTYYRRKNTRRIKYLIYIRPLTPPPRYSALIMCLNPIYVKGQRFPCRKCVECKIQYSEDWARRVVLEAKKHEKNCFLTLTYNDANLPAGASVCKRSAQLFLKRLRKAIAPCKVRYFLCGEYGAEKNRPHYHVILFGYDFEDKWYFTTDRRGNPIYRSSLLERLWSVEKKDEHGKKYYESIGFSSVGDTLDFETAKYCAKYMQADCREFEKLGLKPPFTLMSRRPGIALDVVPKSVYQSGDIYIDGKRYLAPRAFLKIVKRDFPEYYEKVILSRKLTQIDKLKQNVGVDFDFELLQQDESVKALFDDLFAQAVYNNSLSMKERRKKYKKIFGKSLDKDFKLVVSLKGNRKVYDKD